MVQANLKAYILHPTLAEFKITPKDVQVLSYG